MKKLSLCKIALLSLVGILIVSCASETKVGGTLGLVTDVEITFTVNSDINPDERNQPSPLFVRLYELKSDVLFDQADFIDLFENDEEKLAADFIRKQELTRLIPGEDRIKEFVAAKETRYIALYAEFFQYQDSRYKVIFPVTPNNIFKNKVKITVSGTRITLEE